jgi:preprotein translocase subunit YajC
MLISPAYAQDASGIMSNITQFAPLVLIFGVFYFLLIRPQQQKQKEMKAMLGNLKRNDKVITGGGIVGIVSKPPSEDGREIEVEIAPGVKVTVLRETIASVVQPPKPANDSKAK